MAKSYSEADMGSMAGYNPNLGLPKGKVPTSMNKPNIIAPSQVRPRGNAQTRGEVSTAPRRMMGTPKSMPGSTRAMAPRMVATKGMKSALSAFGRMAKGRRTKK